jgi:hypothetical protein
MNANTPLDPIEMVTKLALERMGIDVDCADYDAFEEDLIASFQHTQSRCLKIA